MLLLLFFLQVLPAVLLEDFLPLLRVLDPVHELRGDLPAARSGVGLPQQDVQLPDGQAVLVRLQGVLQADLTFVLQVLVQNSIDAFLGRQVHRDLFFY